MGNTRIIREMIDVFGMDLYEELLFSDLPFFEECIAEIKLNKEKYTGIGISIKSKKIAQGKVIFESIERASLFCDKAKKRDFIKSTIKALDNHNIKHIDIDNEAYFSKSQIIDTNQRRLKININNEFSWTKGVDLYMREKILIPSQLVFLDSIKDEKIIQQQISTGAAGGNTLNDAILRGIFKVIERDAFMIHYLAKTYGGLIDFSMNKRLIKIKRYFKKYNLELYLVNLPTDLGIYTYMAFIIDKTGLGIPFFTGMKTGINPYNIAIGAIEESYMVIVFSRNKLLKKMMLKVKKFIQLEIVNYFGWIIINYNISIPG
ncbi:YcaO-like family protein [Patescibacteria group bacterium]|nr:YcaO-like family protein [Patescibacteria group bacterium]